MKVKRAKLLALIVGGCFVLIGAVFFDKLKSLFLLPFHKRSFRRRGE